MAGDTVRDTTDTRADTGQVDRLRVAHLEAGVAVLPVVLAACWPRRLLLAMTRSGRRVREVYWSNPAHDERRRNLVVPALFAWIERRPDEADEQGPAADHDAEVTKNRASGGDLRPVVRVDYMQAQHLLAGRLSLPGPHDAEVNPGHHKVDRPEDCERYEKLAQAGTTDRLTACGVLDVARDPVRAESAARDSEENDEDGYVDDEPVD